MLRLLYWILLSFAVLYSQAQEGLTNLSGNLSYMHPELSAPAPLDQKPNVKGKPASLTLPFKDDFYYATTRKYADPLLWNDSSVYINSGFAIAPPSIGVATFDGLNKHGYPYNNSASPNLTSSGPADTLCTNPINLYTVGTQTLLPHDKVGLTFYYQIRGYGESPEANDSLILDLYKPAQNKWKQHVWFVKGNANPNFYDTTFKRVFIGIRDTAYFHDGFKFRFRNSATNSGNFDHFHLDYVYLNQGRDSIADTTYNDVTFAQIPTPWLKEYSAMPYQQYNPTEMGNSNTVLIKNNHNAPLNIYYENRFYNEKTGAQTYSYSAQAANIYPFADTGYFDNPAFLNPASHATFNYKFPLMQDSTDFKIKHFVYRNGTNTDFITENDTVVQYHRFRNYYAFDDGSPEAGYYVLGAGGSMAVRIRVNVTDTLRALRVYFDPAPIGSATKYYFRIKVWDGVASPQNTLAVKDVSYYPKYYNSGFKEIPEFKLGEYLVLTPGTYFIGIQQQLSTGLVVGFDRNYDSHQNFFYNAGSGWNQSGIRGSIMMRPVFGAYIPPPVGLNEQTVGSNNFLVYPNPASDHFILRSATETPCDIQILNMLGSVVYNGLVTAGDNEVNTDRLTAGIYLVKISEADKTLFQQKIVISK